MLPKVLGKERKRKERFPAGEQVQKANNKQRESNEHHATAENSRFVKPMMKAMSVLSTG